MFKWLGNILGLGGKIADKIARDKAPETIVLKHSSDDLESARQHDIQTGTGSGPLFSGLRSSVRIIGGHFSQGILFFNILAPHFNMERIVLTDAEYILLGTIITFFYGGRIHEIIRKGR
jgi:hypothetical protein